jgi:hypothetical protein
VRFTITLMRVREELPEPETGEEYLIWDQHNYHYLAVWDGECFVSHNAMADADDDDDLGLSDVPPGIVIEPRWWTRVPDPPLDLDRNDPRLN